MAEPLRPDGEVYVDDVVIRTPDMTGQVEVQYPTSPGMREEELTSAQFLDALGDAGVSEQLSVVISDHQTLTPTEGTRAESGGDDIEIDVPAPGDGFGQVLLYAAENGSLSWHLPDLPPDEVPHRGGERRTYRVPRAIVPARPADGAVEGADRGVLGAIGKKVLKLLVFPLVDPLVGRAADFFVSRWESQHRPSRVRWMRVPGYNHATDDSLTRGDWSTVRHGRALMLVHGTFSTAHGGFGKLDADTMTALHHRYDGRVIAFDHPTVSVTPAENAAALAALVPDGQPVEVDLVTHSRGGLVGREIAALDTFDVRGVVMVASPNGGTALADKDHLSQLLDRFTNLAQFVPDNGVTQVLEIVFTVLKQLAVGAVGGLDGLMAMNPDPDEEYLKGLNGRAAVAAKLRAIAADFEPPEDSEFGTVVKDAGVDILFGSAENDLVVPTRGCWDVTAAGFPIGDVDRLLLPPSAAINHNAYFGQDDVRQRLLEWLPTP
jgi:pimeloyl-ACP methyl ester carboxylesterase